MGQDLSHLLWHELLWPVYAEGDYQSKCGREWKGEPPINDECNHVECAIWAQEQYCKTFGNLSLFMIGFGLFCILLGRIFSWEFLSIFSPVELIMGVIPGICYLDHHLKVRSLENFQNNGTIQGMKAHQI